MAHSGLISLELTSLQDFSKRYSNQMNNFHVRKIFSVYYGGAIFGCRPQAAQPQISVFSSFSSSSSFRRRLPKIFLFWYQHCLALAFLCNTLALHQPFICIASALHWHCIGSALAMHWVCIGARLILHLCCVDDALALHWGCIRATSTLHLCCIGTKLALHQHCIDSILALVLHCISFLQHFAISLSVKQHCRQRRTESIFSLVPQLIQEWSYRNTKMSQKEVVNLSMHQQI